MKKNMRILLAVLVLVLLVVNSVMAASEDIDTLKAKLAKEPKNVALLKQIGIYYHTLSDQGDKKAVDEALKYFEEAIKLAPADYSLKAWYGSVLTMVARDSVNPLTKYFKVKDGLKLMDEAVEKEPENWEIRMTRAMTTKSIPADIFGRLQQSIDDFSYLINKEKAQPGYMPEREKLLAYLHIGIALKDANNIETAVRVWKKLIEIAPDSVQAKEAKELVKKYDF